MVDNLGTPPYQGYLNDKCVTLAEVMRSAGYRTLMSGKWRVGEVIVRIGRWTAGSIITSGSSAGPAAISRLDAGRQMADG